jgi:hypothetical protein
MVLASPGPTCRCRRPRSLCFRSCSSYARTGRCRSPRSPCNGSAGGYAGRCWCPAGLASAPLAVVLEDDGAPAVLAVAPDAAMLADAGAPAFLADAPSGGYARTSCAPSEAHSPAASASPFPPRLPPSLAPQNRWRAASPCCRQPAPRGTRGTCPGCFRGPAPASSPGPFSTAP